MARKHLYQPNSQTWFWAAIKLDQHQQRLRRAIGWLRRRKPNFIYRGPIWQWVYMLDTAESDSSKVSLLGNGSTFIQLTFSGGTLLVGIFNAIPAKFLSISWPNYRYMQSIFQLSKGIRLWCNARMTLTGLHSVVSGRTYTLTVSGTAGGIAFTGTPVSKTCPWPADKAREFNQPDRQKNGQ